MSYFTRWQETAFCHAGTRRKFLESKRSASRYVVYNYKKKYEVLVVSDDRVGGKEILILKV